jgi:hypothetical protein
MKPGFERNLDEVEAEIAGGLGRFAASTRQPIAPGSRLYHDLGLAGDDLFDALVWLSHRFSIDLTGMDLRRFAPGEGWDIWGWPWPFPQRTYRELTVRDLADIVRAGSWAASGIGRRR